MLRELGIRNSSPPLSKPHLLQNIDVQPFPLSVLPRPDIPVGGRLAHFVDQREELTDNKWVLSIIRNGFKSPFMSVPPISVVPIKLSQSSSLLLQDEIAELLKKRAVERVWNPGTKRKVTTSNRSFAAKSVHKQTSFQNGDSQFSKAIDKGQRLGCLHRPDGCISSCSDTSNIQEISPFHLQTPGISVQGLIVRNVTKSVHFDAINECSSRALKNTCSISLFIPRRLVNKRSDSQSTNLSHKIYSSNGSKSGFHTKSERQI